MVGMAALFRGAGGVPNQNHALGNKMDLADIVISSQMGQLFQTNLSKIIIF